MDVSFKYRTWNYFTILDFVEWLQWLIACMLHKFRNLVTDCVCCGNRTLHEIMLQQRAIYGCKQPFYNTPYKSQIVLSCIWQKEYLHISKQSRYKSGSVMTQKDRDQTK